MIVFFLFGGIFFSPVQNLPIFSVLSAAGYPGLQWSAIPHRRGLNSGEGLRVAFS